MTPSGPHEEERHDRRTIRILGVEPGALRGLKQVPLRTADLERQLDAKEQEPIHVARHTDSGLGR
jgi:hypothetical protein